MITRRKVLNLPETYPLNRLGELDQILFFDIETTGFSGDYSNLYLIGCTYYQNQTWNLIQWLADDRQSEPLLLEAFFAFLKQYSVLVHFNGDGFDIPYLLKRCRYYQLDYDFSGVQSIDIYKRIKPYKKLLGLTSMKQKAVEQYLGISREDLYSGGQLIEVYQDYLITHDDFLYDLLILHNEDDLKGMPSILPVLNYSDFLGSTFSLKEQSVLSERDLFGEPLSTLLLRLESPYSLPVGFDRKEPPFACSASGNELLLQIALTEGELKYYYSNYKEYYYLIYEDNAIHKSIGEYVDRNARKQATAKTCYTRKAGCYLPQPQIIWEPALRPEYKSRLTYTDYQESLFSDEEQLQNYVRLVLSYLS